MSNQETDKLAICSRLLAGETASAISESYDDIPYSTILRYKRELEEAQHNNTLSSFLDLEKAVLNDIMLHVQENKPASLNSEISAVTKGLLKSKDALETLNLSFIASANAINKKILAMSISADNPVEIESLTNSLCKLQNAFFNKPITQVNVQNNYEQSGGKYNTWLGDSISTSTEITEN
jgi:hypothetical protein